MSTGCGCNFSGTILGRNTAHQGRFGFTILGANTARQGRLSGFGTANPFAVTQSVPPVVLSVTVAKNLVVASTLISQGAAPSPAQAINLIKTLVPPKPFATNLRPPQPGGLQGNQMTSTLSGLSFGASQVLRRPGFGIAVNTVGVGGQAAGVVGRAVGGSTGSTIASVGAAAALGASVGSVVPVVGTAIGAAVGAIAGLVMGLFGHKKSVPEVSAADVQQAQTWLGEYTQVAGSVVGRNFQSSAISDMITAMAIMNPGFWGRPDSTHIDLSAVTNFVQEELTRLRYFFLSLQNIPTGQPVTLRDIPAIPGHGKTNLNVTYTFINPGINAPSYVLGPYFAQYFYTMCTIFESGSNCSGHLTAPFPQMHTDILDYVRSGNSAWDTPQPNVVTGSDLSLVAPTEVAGGSEQSNIVVSATSGKVTQTAASTAPSSVKAIGPVSNVPSQTFMPQSTAPSSVQAIGPVSNVPSQTFMPQSASYAEVPSASQGMVQLPDGSTVAATTGNVPVIQSSGFLILVLIGGGLLLSGLIGGKGSEVVQHKLR